MGRGLLGNMEGKWAERCEMIQDDQCKTPATEKAWVSTLCSNLQTCVCKGDGEQAFHFQQNLVDLMLKPNLRIPITRTKKTDGTQPKSKTKAEIKKEKKPHARLMSESGFLVLHFRHVSMIDESNHQSHAASSSSGGVTSAESHAGPMALSSWTDLANAVAPFESRKAAEFYFYIGFMNYSTYRFSGMQLLPIMQDSSRGQHLCTPFDAPFRTCLEFWREHVDFDFSWKVRALILRSRNVAIPMTEMVPGTLIADKYDEIPEFVVWHGRLAEESRRRKIAMRNLGTGYRSSGAPKTRAINKKKKKTETRRNRNNSLYQRICWLCMEKMLWLTLLMKITEVIWI